MESLKQPHNDDACQNSTTPLGRRELMRLGAGVVAATLAVRSASGQDEEGGGGRGGRGRGRGEAPQTPAPPPGSAPPAGEWRPHTGPGFQNTYDRYGENGQMDDTSKEVVDYVYNFKYSDLTSSTIKAINRTMVDSTAAILGGFEEEAVRVAARTASLSPAGKYKCTVFGYGLTSTPELASFANSCMVRLVDFNETPHNSNLIPAALAMGEALHSTGRDVMAAIAVGYEVTTVPGAGESAPVAMAVGKLMGLDADHLANALTLAITPHVALNKGVGSMSMWKGCRSAEAVKCGVWAAVLAQAGMTGPPQPFEGRGGVWYTQGRMGRPFTMPARPDSMAIEHGVNKRFPSDQMTQQTLSLVPQMRAWTKPEEIESITYYLPFGNWEECGDAPKWDPRNRDTADHSIPYTLTRSLISGESYLDSFSPDKLPFRDPQAKDLINRITLQPVAEWGGNGTARIVIRKKTGEEKTFDTHNGSRDPGNDMSKYPQMSDDDITNKFKRVATYRHVNDAQRDKMLAQWWDIGSFKDISEPISTMAKYGNPKPL